MKKQAGRLGLYFVLLALLAGSPNPAKGQDFGIHVAPAMAFPLNFGGNTSSKPLTGFKLGTTKMMEETVFPETAYLSLGFSYFLPQKQTQLTPVIRSNSSWEEAMLHSQSRYWQLSLHTGWEIYQRNQRLMLLFLIGLSYHRFSTTYEASELSRQALRIDADEKLYTNQNHVLRLSPLSGDFHFSAQYKIENISLFAQVGYQFMITRAFRSETRPVIPHFSPHMIVANAGLFIRLYTY